MTYASKRQSKTVLSRQVNCPNCRELSPPLGGATVATVSLEDSSATGFEGQP